MRLTPFQAQSGVAIEPPGDTRVRTCVTSLATKGWATEGGSKHRRRAAMRTPTTSSSVATGELHCRWATRPRSCLQTGGSSPPIGLQQQIPCVLTSRTGLPLASQNRRPFVFAEGVRKTDIGHLYPRLLQSGQPDSLVTGLIQITAGPQRAWQPCPLRHMGSG